METVRRVARTNVFEAIFRVSYYRAPRVKFSCCAPRAEWLENGVGLSGADASHGVMIAGCSFLFLLLFYLF